jgi:hypothetical protein
MSIIRQDTIRVADRRTHRYAAAVSLWLTAVCSSRPRWLPHALQLRGLELRSRLGQLAARVDPAINSVFLLLYSLTMHTSLSDDSLERQIYSFSQHIVYRCKRYPNNSGILRACDEQLHKDFLLQRAVYGNYRWRKFMFM